MESKTCACCNRTYSGNTTFELNKYFNWRNKEKMKLASYCKECTKEKSRERYENNREEIRRKNKEYYDTNKHIYQNYYQSNKDILVKRSHEWNSDNKEKRSEYNKKYYKKIKYNN